MCASFVVERKLCGYLIRSVDSAEKKNIKDLYFLFNATYLNFNFQQISTDFQLVQCSKVSLELTEM